VTTSFVRFQVGNGLVSLVGNVVLMRLLVQGAGLPVLIANLVAIGCCSVANFWVGEVWAFAVPKGNGSPQSARLRRVLLLLPLLLLFYGPGLAQTASAVNLPREGGLGTDCAYANWFVGPASATGGKLSLNTFTGELRLGNTSREASGVASRPLRSSSWEWSGSSRMEPRWMDLGV
jgi:hypothetical protein